ncbi:carbohydrate porin [Bradyrhizobium sp. 30]|uniref:carbohydrate porin n=1 Tax=Bradyrhizobium sp. 30 TaxID=2782669 RepID=UPI002097E9D5|nr:carbohydrate porin [Bradyrhizobium sp. 30]
MATRPDAVRPTRRSATATALISASTNAPLLLGQIQYAWNNKKGDPSLTGQIKFGGWRHFGSFADQRLASNGASLAAAASSSGEPLLLSGDVGGWAVFEQQIHRVPHSDDPGIGVFARAAGAPADRNLIDLYADVGVEFIGLRDDRPDDKFGIAAGYAHVSKRAQALDADYRTLVDMTWPVRSFEGLLTAVYQLSGQGRLDVTAQFPIHVAAFMRMAILSWLRSGCEPLPGGQPYENDYCFVFVVAGDSIKQVREYMDTRKGWQMIFKPD